MRPAAAILILALASAARAQNPAPPSPVQIRTLTLVSADLPLPEREYVIQSIEGRPYIVNEFEEHVRTSLRNLGYYNARVHTARLSAVQPGQNGASANVSLKVNPGAKYSFGVIQFNGATIFTLDELRSQFPFAEGSQYNVASLSYGLERLKNLYQQKGYINFGAIPTPAVDESHHVVHLVIDIDEGQPYTFGHLVFKGIEPHAGAGQELTASWASLQGKTYNPDLLSGWLSTNWPGGTEALNRVKTVPDDDPHEVNVFLQFP
jgi:outer membrane translocation and assembly module TamA